MSSPNTEAENAALRELAVRVEDAINRSDAEAARYRWVRENWWLYGNDDYTAVPSKIGGAAFWEARDRVKAATTPEELDASVDMAIMVERA